MTLDQIRYFQAICNYGGICRAAEHLNISQPSLSNAIRKLEDEFGTRLFLRQNKKLVLTKEGTILLGYATDLLRSVEETERTMKNFHEGKALNLGVPPMLSAFILPILFQDFFPKHPEIQINIVEAERKGLVQMLEDNRIDLAFFPHDKPWDDKFKSKHLTDFANVCCVSRNHRLAKKKSVTLDDIKDEPLILFKNSFFHTERILERYEQKGYSPNILFDTVQVSTVQSIAASGNAIGFMFEFLAKRAPNLVGIPLSPPMNTHVSLVWRRDILLTSHMRCLIDFVSRYAKTLLKTSEEKK